MSMFTKATKESTFARICLQGPSGAGKTYTALTIAKVFGGRVAVVDTERGSASKYADLFDFDVAELGPPYSPQRLVETLREAKKEGYNTAIVDSFTHFWKGAGGILETVDEEADRAAATRRGGRDTFSAWKKGDVLYRSTIDALLDLQMHLIVTMRAKQITEKGEDGKIRKLGLGAEFREGAEYEFDIEGMIDMENRLHVGKTRCPTIKGKTVSPERTEAFAAEVLGWARNGRPAAPRPHTDAVPTSLPAEPVLAPPPYSPPVDIPAAERTAMEAERPRPAPTAEPGSGDTMDRALAAIRKAATPAELDELAARVRKALGLTQEDPRRVPLAAAYNERKAALQKAAAAPPPANAEQGDPADNWDRGAA